MLNMILEFEKIIVIDYYRRFVDWIEQVFICYLEIYVLFVFEFVVEFLSYEGIKLKKFEVEILLVGIMIDIRGFIKNVGVRIFEVVMYFRENDVMLEVIKEYLKEDLESYILKSQFILNLKIIYSNIVFVVDYL